MIEAPQSNHVLAQSKWPLECHGQPLTQDGMSLRVRRGHPGREWHGRLRKPRSIQVRTAERTSHRIKHVLERDAFWLPGGAFSSNSRHHLLFSTANGGLQASFDRAAAAPSPSRSPGTAAAAGTSAAGAAAAASPPPAAARTPEPRAAEAVDRVTLLNDKARADLQERLWAQERAAQEVARLGEIAARPPSKVDKMCDPRPSPAAPSQAPTLIASV